MSTRWLTTRSYTQCDINALNSLCRVDAASQSSRQSLEQSFSALLATGQEAAGKHLLSRHLRHLAAELVHLSVRIGQLQRMKQGPVADRIDVNLLNLW